MAGLNEDMRMAMVMNDGGMNPGLMNAEKMQSGLKFSFTQMQNKFWEAATKTYLLYHKDFLRNVVVELSDDQEAKETLFQAIFEKLHLDLCDIKSRTFSIAERNLETLKTVLDFEGAPEVFVNSQHFFNPALNGSQFQKATYFGRYLSFSALTFET